VPAPHDPQQDPHLPEIPFLKQVGILRRLLNSSDEFLKLAALSAGLLFILLATAYGQVTLNQWNVPFYNAIEQRNVPEFIRQLQIFVFIATGLLILNVAQNWFQQTLSVMMRKAIVKNLIDCWLHGNKASKLDKTDFYAQNPDQRIHQDTRQLADSTTGLTIGFIQSTILLLSFVGILWNVSEGFVFHYNGHDFSLPGYMVWAAFLYVGLASALSKWVGRGLVRLNAAREAQEAEFRTALVTIVSENHNYPTVDDSERKISFLRGKFQSLYLSVKKLILTETNLTWISSGFGWMAIVVPILAAAPIYFSGGLNFGGLMMTVGAFNQVYSALRWYVNNYQAIAEWRAHLLRITGFHTLLAD
jgi:putative ATP-binding cassette transporter